MFVFSLIACTWTTHTKHYGSHHVAINTNFPGVPKLRIIFLGLFQHCCHYLENKFNGQPYSLDWQMMNLCLLWCLWPTLMNVLEKKIRSTGPRNHTGQRLCGRSQNRNAVEAKIWTEWNIHIVIISFWHHVFREVYTNIMEEIFAPSSQ